MIGINSAHFEELGFETHFNGPATEMSIVAYRLTSTPIYEDEEADDPERVSNVAVFEVS